MNKSETIGKLSLALSKAQSEMPEVKKNAQNPFLKNKYADLGAVIEASRGVLAKNELAVTQFPVSDGDKIGVTTLLAHSSGEWLEDTILISATDAKGLSFAQSAGVVISYLRRYAWASILGMYADEDTDGNHPKTSEPVRKPQESPKPESTKEHEEAVKAFVAAFNAIPQERKGEAQTITGAMSKASVEDIRKATAHNVKLMEGK